MLREKLIVSTVLMGVSFATLGFTRLLKPIFSTNYLPHRYCYLAEPWLVWTNSVMDTLIALAYVAIFSCLLWLALQLKKSAELKQYLWIFVSFALFIGACGATHVMEIVTVWWPVYPLSAGVKVMCGLASIPTAFFFARETPRLATSITRFIRLDVELRTANEELRRSSRRDALTSLLNRGYFDSSLEAEWHRALRTGIPLAVVLMDVDNFKMLNDRYGHLVGDECLRRIGQVLFERQGRAEDLIARYGGEEFALILPGSDLCAAHAIAEEIRLSIQGLKIPNVDSPVSSFVTVSIGVASHIPQPEETFTMLLAASDAALYRAKREGRNRTESASGATKTA